MLNKPGSEAASEQAPAPDEVGQPTRSRTILGLNQRMFAIVAAVVVTAAAVVGFGIYKYAATDQQAEQAIDKCVTAVRGQLKSPSTAKFSSLESQISTTPESKTAYPAPSSLADLPNVKKYVVVGNIDSQNGFGATIRTHFNCTAFYSSGTFSGTHVAWIKEGSGT